GFHRHGLTPAPGLALVLQQQGQERPAGLGLGLAPFGRGVAQGACVVRFDHGASSRPSCSATRSRARDSLRRRASAPPPSSAAIAAQSHPWFLSSRILRSSAESRRCTSSSRSRTATSVLGLASAATNWPSSGFPEVTWRPPRRWASCLRAWEFSLFRA